MVITLSTFLNSLQGYITLVADYVISIVVIETKTVAMVTNTDVRVINVSYYTVLQQFIQRGQFQSQLLTIICSSTTCTTIASYSGHVWEDGKCTE